MRLCLFVCVLVGLVACRDATAPEPTPMGSLSAVVSGAVVDTFEATGAEPPPTRTPVTFASARVGVDPGGLGIMGFRARGELQDAVLLDLRGALQPGTYPASGSFQWGIRDRDYINGQVFRLVAGEVRITHRSNARVQGTFQATAVTALLPFGATPDTVHILGGTFDVPILPSPVSLPQGR